MKNLYLLFSTILLVLSAFSCSTEDLEVTKNTSYLKIDVNTVVNTVTRTNAPEGYNAKQLYVEIKNSRGVVVKSTPDFHNDYSFKGYIELEAGKYTINAHSNGWDGSGSGLDVPYYVGSTTINLEAKASQSVRISCTQANVKVTVSFDENLANYFQTAKSTINSAISGIDSQVFEMGETTSSAYFPVGNLTAVLDVVNKKGTPYRSTEEIQNVKARDHYILNYKLVEPGSIGDGSSGSFKVIVDETTNTYTYNFPILLESGEEEPTEDNTSIQALEANTWSNVAFLQGTISNKANSFKNTNVTIQYKENSGSWKSINGRPTISGNNIEYKLENLKSETTYSYQILYKGVASNAIEFTTKEGIYNHGFENWYTDGKIQVACERGITYWNSSNAGAANYVGSVTTQDNTFKHSGSSSAKLASKYAVIKFAAASLFTGNFVGLIGTKGAKLDWGVPFTSCPKALRGFLSYTAGSNFRGTKPSILAAKPANDNAQIFCALVSEQFHVANAEASGYEMTTTIDWQNDSRVIAYGELTKAGSSTANTWEEFRIELNYHRQNVNPSYLIIVCSASKWGDYFYGSDESVLYLDDFTFEY